MVDFEIEHYRNILAQERQIEISTRMDEESLQYTKSHGECYTLIDGDEIVGCGGVVEIWKDRGMAWTLISENIGKRFVGLHRVVTRFLDTSKFKRVEMYVDYDFIEAHRWATMLGFTLEAEQMLAFLPNGKSASLYARIR